MYLESFKSQHPPVSICHAQAAYLIRFPVQIQSNLSIMKHIIVKLYMYMYMYSTT
jgi:hypothetical protein